MNDCAPYIIENDIFLTYLKIIMSKDSDRWLETIESEMNSQCINQVWTMVEASMGMTQQVANRNINLDFLLAIATHHLESFSSGRANPFMD